ncbi:MAG: HD domain-containing protein [Myxococcales bacterium]|nr:HD domain-containing protein [Myxococcales bacterium]
MAEEVHEVPEALRRLVKGLMARLPEVRVGREALGPEVGVELGRVRATLFDQLFAQLFPQALAAAAVSATGVALGAVGSYGRGAVALAGDLDVRILGLDARRGEELGRVLLYPLWDAGLAVGHQVVSVDELIAAARDDLPTATSLLDYRHLAGDLGPSGELTTRARASVFAAGELADFVGRLRREVAERHRRFGGSVYMLEPDITHGPGALRDLDVAGWAAAARWGVHDLEGLLRRAVVTARELGLVQTARERLWRVRNVLHALAGRRSDRLGFEEQESVAAALGYEGEAHEAVERLMSDYYRAADAVARFRDAMLDRAVPTRTQGHGRRRPATSDVGDGVVLFDGEAALARSELLQEDPVVALRLVSAAARHGVPIHPHARSAIVAAASSEEWSEALRGRREAAELFAELVTSRAETRLKGGSPMRELHELGLLLAMVPEFGPVVGRVHHDTYHVYTVDVHSVAAVDRLVELARGEWLGPGGDEPGRDAHADKPAWGGALASELAGEIARPRVLFFATLLHDVGKAIGGRDHSERGAEMVRGILPRLGFAPDDVEDVAWLVHHHLRMYHVATRRDLDDRSTVAELVADIGSREALRELYLLTVADLSTTSPTSMTSWKARMLDELWLAADQALSERSAAAAEAAPHAGSGADAGAPDPARVPAVTALAAQQATRLERAHAAVLEASAALAPPGEADARRAFVVPYLESMPERYLLRHAPESVAAHAELARRSLADPFGLTRVASRQLAAAELCVVAPDRPGLLAAITAAFSGSRLEVHAAEVHSRRTAPSGSAGAPAVQAVDLFWVRHAVEGVAGVDRGLAKVRADLGAVLSGSATTRAVARLSRPGLRRPARDVATQVVVDHRASPEHSVIEVVARDRPGLLFTLANALHQAGLSIAVAKINTEGARVIDVFYVTSADGGKLAPGEPSERVRQLLRAEVERMDVPCRALKGPRVVARSVVVPRPGGRVRPRPRRQRLTVPGKRANLLPWRNRTSRRRT